jgi:hypothetical protein
VATFSTRPLTGSLDCTGETRCSCTTNERSALMRPPGAGGRGFGA